MSTEGETTSDAKCVWCGRRISRGDSFYTSPFHGPYCMECAPDVIRADKQQRGVGGGNETAPAR